MHLSPQLINLSERSKAGVLATCEKHTRTEACIAARQTQGRAELARTTTSPIYKSASRAGNAEVGKLEADIAMMHILHRTRQNGA